MNPYDDIERLLWKQGINRPLVLFRRWTVWWWWLGFAILAAVVLRYA